MCRERQCRPIFSRHERTRERSRTRGRRSRTGQHLKGISRVMAVLTDRIRGFNRAVQKGSSNRHHRGLTRLPLCCPNIGRTQHPACRSPEILRVVCRNRSMVYRMLRTYRTGSCGQICDACYRCYRTPPVTQLKSLIRPGLFQNRWREPLAIS